MSHLSSVSEHFDEYQEEEEEYGEDEEDEENDDQPLQHEHFGRLLAQELLPFLQGLMPAREHLQAPEEDVDNNDHGDGEDGDGEDGGDAHLGGSV